MRNVGVLPHHCTASQLRRPRIEFLNGPHASNFDPDAFVIKVHISVSELTLLGRLCSYTYCCPATLCNRILGNYRYFLAL
jgi:hypothetical protein